MPVLSTKTLARRAAKRHNTLVGTTCNEEGLVTRLAADGRAVVTVERGEACHSCVARGACQTLGGQTQDIQLVVDNSLGAAPGDRVVLTLAESAVVGASAVLYLLPALGLVAGAFAGYAAAGAAGADPDPASILGCGLGLGLGLAASRLIAGRAARGERFTPRLTRITGHVDLELD